MEAPRSLPGSGWRAARDLARGLRLCALIAALWGAAAAPASAAAGPGVLVEGPAGRQRLVAPAEFDDQEVRGQYTLRATPGENPAPLTFSGMRVSALLETAKVDLGAIRFFTVPRADGTKAYLPASDLSDQAFPDGPALVWVETASGVTRFLRPVTSDPNDVNAPDDIATRPGEALVIGVSEGNLLQVHAEASPASTEAGAPVELTASASGAKEGEEVRFRWSFGDGGSAEGASVSHAFGGSGTYQVRVTAEGTEESGGESEPVAVVVGNPPTSSQPGAAPTSKAKQHRKASGPSGNGREGRGGNGSEGSGGNGKGQSGGGNQSSPVRSEAGGGESGEAPEASPESSATETPLPAETEPPPSSPPAKESTPAPAAKPTAPESATAAETVEGRLVGDLLDPAEAAAASASSEASESAPGAVPGDGGRTVPVVALIVLGLLGAGAALELRPRPRPRPR
jgi:PKD repeat protein